MRITTARSLNAIDARRRTASHELQVISADMLGNPPTSTRKLKPDEYFKTIVNLAAPNKKLKIHDSSENDLLSFISAVYNTPEDYLDTLLNSFLIQESDNWELIFCNDGSTNQRTLAWLERHKEHPRIKILHNTRNGGIASATNLGILAAEGEWVGFVDHDDALTPHALHHLNKGIARHADAALVYTDEVITDPKLKPVGYFFKPAFDPVLLSGVNYINHLCLYRRKRLLQLGGLKLGYDGAQDYELLLRYLADLPVSAVVHLPYPAYMWRRHPTSYSTSFLDVAVSSARRALSAAYRKDEADCPVGQALVADLHRVHFEKRHKIWPLVSVIIPNRDSFELIGRVIGDLLDRTDYPSLEIIVVDNGTTDSRVIDLYSEYQARHANFRTYLSVEAFNFARQINRGLHKARGQAMLLLNNDIEIQDPAWLREMVGCLEYPNTGIVGARLLYPSGKLQHAGVIVGLGGLAGHWYGGSAASTSGPMNRLQVRQSFSAVTGACMLISRTCYEMTGDLDEDNFAIAYNDIDYCLRAASAGFRAVWTPFATLTHHESASRGSDETDANRPRFQREKTALRQKYGTDHIMDPAFSPWYSTAYGVPREIIPQEIPAARRWTTLSIASRKMDGAGHNSQATPASQASQPAHPAPGGGLSA